MNENTARTSTRWGAGEEKNVPAFDPVLGIPGIVEVQQFVDLALLSSQEMALALYAVAAAPVAGLTVKWTVSIGNGSNMQDEIFVTSVQVIDAQSPLVLKRPAKSVRISAKLINMQMAVRGVKIVAHVAPVAPTWVTDLQCSEAMRVPE
jgi:hypothetical protein